MVKPTGASCVPARERAGGSAPSCAPSCAPWRALACAPLLVLLALSPLLGWEDEQVRLGPELVAGIEAALAAPEPRDAVPTLWDLSIRETGSPVPLIDACESRLRARLEEALLAAPEDGEPDLATPDITALRRLSGRLSRVLGDLERAYDLVAKIPPELETRADRIERAQLLDALGRDEEAHKAFGRVLEEEIDPELRQEILLRRALLLDPKEERLAAARGERVGSVIGSLITSLAIPLTPAGTTAAATLTPATPTTPAAPAGTGSAIAIPAGLVGALPTGAAPSRRREEEPERKPTALARFALDPERDAALANQAAMILGLRGEQSDAIEAFRVMDGDGSHRYRQEVRLAEWALEAEEWEAAQAFSWAAVRSAKMKRDRRYALTILVEAYRRDRALPALIEQIAAESELSEETRQVWIDLLRETGQVEAALTLFREGSDGEFTIDMRRELLEMCRETGQEALLVSAYADLIAQEPRFIEWREGLSRYHLERGDRERALTVWSDYLSVTDDLRYRMAAASTLMAIGLDDRAVEFARACQGQGPEARNGALLFLFELSLARSRMDEARERLDELVSLAEGVDPVHKEIADAFARLGDKARAVEVLDAYRTARGADSNPDTDMKLALLLSDIGEEERALELWGEIWRAVESIPRRRYVEERLMAVASRLGKLASIAVRIERNLRDGTADDREVGLLVRLYTHVKDPVSATEIVEVHWGKAGRKATEVLAEKARIFVACEDFYNYELVIEELIELDPENRGDYLRQLAMSKLESGEQQEARAILERLKVEEADTASLEFEAGVLAIAGLREEALAAYRRSLVEHPERIDTYLLLSNLQKELGRHDRSAGMFQYLAETAEKDDLFTIAIDGILNMRDGRSNTGAPDRLVEWGRRIVMERISRRPDKLYLYRLLADLCEELSDTEGAIRALKMALPIAGEQRTPILRELMAMATPGRRGGMMRPSPIQDREGDESIEQLMFGRRLLGQGELVPPQVYLELGEAFLGSREVVNATKTFQRMSQLPEFGEMQAQIAESFERGAYPREALRIYERMLTVEPTSVPLLAKVGELHEQLGRDDLARELYQRGLRVVLGRRVVRKTVRKDDEGAQPAVPSFYGNRNVDDAEQYYGRLLAGVVSTLDPSDADRYLDILLADIDEDLASVIDDAPRPDTDLAEFPRLQGRLAAYRAIAGPMGRSARVEAIDRRLLSLLPDDEDLLGSLVRARISDGRVVAARALLDEADRPEKQKKGLALLVGGARTEDLPGVIPIGEAAALVLPLLAAGDGAAVVEVLNRLDLSTGDAGDAIGRMPLLISTAIFLEDADLVLSLCRHYLNLMIQQSPGRLYGGVQEILQRSGTILDEARRRSLVEQIVDAINENPDKFGGFVSRLADLQKELGGTLFTSEQVERLIDKRLEANDQFIYGIADMLGLLPAGERGTVARRIWPRLPKAQTGMFALELVPVLEEEVAPEFAEFLVQAFRQGVEKADDPNMFQYFADSLADSPGANAEVALRFLQVLKAREPGNISFRAGEAVLLLAVGRGDEAWEVARKLYAERLESLGGDRDYVRDRALDRVVAAFQSTRFEEFLATIDERIAAAGADPELESIRLDLIEGAGRTELYDTSLLAAAEAFPEDIDLLQRLDRHLRGRGELFERIEVQKRLIEALEGEDERQLRNSENILMSLWRSVDNPIEVLGLLEKEVEEPEEDEGAAKKERTPPATIGLVREAVEGGDLATGLATYRRLWRSFPTGGRDPFGGFVTMGVSRMGGSSRLLWPADPPTEEELEERRQASRRDRPRGGLPDLGEVERLRSEAETRRAEPEESKLRTAAEVLAGLDGGPEELERQLRSLHGSQLGTPAAGDLYDALARREAELSGARAALDGWLARESTGEIGKREYGRIFSLIELTSESDELGLTEILDRLLENVSPTDTVQLRRLARLCVKSGDLSLAGTLYRWCAVVQPGSSFSYWRSADTLLEEVIEQLSGEERIRTVEAVLELSDPGSDAWWGREAYESLVLRTWRNLLGPDRVLEKARAVCEGAFDLSVSPKRSLAVEALPFFLGAGEIDAALRCLEIAACKLEAPANLPYPWYREQFERFGRAPALVDLFPTDLASRPGAAEWCAGIERSVLEWLDAQRIEDGAAFRLLAFCTLRQHELGLLDDRDGRLALLRGLTAGSSTLELWLVDLLRALGDGPGADAIERTLLASGRLHLGRIAEVLARIAAAEGGAAALELGESVAAYVLEDELLAVLIGAAESAESEERAQHWREVRTRASEARVELQERDEEARRSSAASRP